MFIGKAISNTELSDLTFVLPPTLNCRKTIKLKNSIIYMVEDWQENITQKLDSNIIIGSIYKNRKVKRTENYVQDLNYNYWGDYICFSIKDDYLKCIFRSISNTTSVYFMIKDKALYFSSHLKYLKLLSKDSPTLNMGHLSRFLLCGQHLSSQTPFNEYSELQLGCKLNIESGYNSEIVWNPKDYLNHEPTKDYSQTLLDTLEYVIGQQSKDLKGVMLDYSGGLDSTALLYILKMQLLKENTLEAINSYHSKVASSNETHIAQNICSSLGVKLFKQDSMKLDLPFAPSGFNNKFLDKIDPMLIRFKADLQRIEVANRRKLPNLFTGEGGDHALMCPPAMESIADLVIEKQYSLIKNKVGELITIYRTNIFNILSNNIKVLKSHYWKRNYKNIIELTQFRADWHTDELISLQGNSSFHPFYHQKTYDIPPGKFYQIDNIYIGLSVITSDIRNQMIKCFYPFLSQPMIEAALGIPSYHLYDKGFDRFPLRKAISQKYSTDNVWRKDKGEATGVYLLGIKKNISYISSLVMEGYFAKEKLINRDLLYTNLQNLSHGYSNNHWALIHLMACELYLNEWKNY